MRTLATTPDSEDWKLVVRKHKRDKKESPVTGDRITKNSKAQKQSNRLTTFVSKVSHCNVN